MITENQTQMVSYIIDSSGVVDLLLDRIRRDGRGRKTDPAPYRLLMIGGLLSVIDNGTFVIKDIYETLTSSIPLDEQFTLGVRRWTRNRLTGEETVRVMSINDLYYVTKRISKALDYGKGSAPNLDEEERERRHDVIQAFCDALMDVFDLGWESTTYALDATGIWSWGRGKAKDETDGANNDDSEESLAQVIAPFA
ncbi:MAG TPA: hypothetical protein ENH00_13550 [Actinobacteria bacterium]|nr:hypothetical protein BMS3Bbin01_02580 [bacterium BMS3Bbin01]HDH27196.1 hypothetical protein [Actinomycetota bacterium]